MGSLDRFCGDAPTFPFMRRVPIRVVCHAILRPDAESASVQALRREIERLCQMRGAILLDLFGDVGTKKESLADVPALLFLHNGVADVLLVVRSADREAGRPRDALDALLLTEQSPTAWATVPMLRRTGLLPPAIGLPTFARQRAAELRARGLTLDVIARWLDTEGYAAPGADPRPDGWTRGDVARLLREKSRNEAAEDILFRL